MIVFILFIIFTLFSPPYCCSTVVATQVRDHIAGASVRLRWVWHRYPSVGLPIMHVLVVTQLYSWCVEIRDSSFIPFLHKWTTEPRPETPVFPSKIRLPSKIPIRSHYLYPGNYRLYQSYSRQYHHTSPSPLRYVAFFFYIASRLQPSALFLRLALNWNTAYSSEASF